MDKTLGDHRPPPIPIPLENRTLARSWKALHSVQLRAIMFKPSVFHISLNANMKKQFAVCFR